jgi:hypothetical protein
VSAMHAARLLVMHLSCGKGTATVLLQAAVCAKHMQLSDVPCAVAESFCGLSDHVVKLQVLHLLAQAVVWAGHLKFTLSTSVPVARCSRCSFAAASCADNYHTRHMCDCASSATVPRLFALLVACLLIYCCRYWNYVRRHAVFTAQRPSAARPHTHICVLLLFLFSAGAQAATRFTHPPPPP